MSVDRTRLAAQAAKGDLSAKRALAVTRRTSFMLSGAQLGITVTGLLVGYVAALTVIYRYGPCRQRARWRWVTPGAIFAAVLSLTVSFLFSWYLSNFVRTDSYGPLAAMMGFLLWTWLSVQVILMGAELNAEIEHQTAVDTTTGKPLPIGERGAKVADSIGPRRGNPAALAFTQRQAEAQRTLEAAQAEWQTALQGSPFEDEQAFITARLDTAEQQDLDRLLGAALQDPEH